MKKMILLAALCSAGLLAGCNETADKPAAGAASDAGRSATLPAKTEEASPVMDAETLLTVNGTPVTRTMYSLYFQDRMRNVPDAKNSPELQMSVLNELSNILIVAQDAEKKGLPERADVAASLYLLKAKLLTQIAIQEHAKATQPTEEQLQQTYDDEYAGQSNTEYKARHILLKEEDEAKSMIAKLAEGADFAELAKQHSTGPTGKSGGDLGWFDAAQMVKPFGDALRGMEKGKYSAAPVQTQFGWHVILLEESRETAAPTLDSVRGKIMSSLQQKALASYMQGLRDSSKLVFNEQNTKPASLPAAENPAAEAPSEQAAPAPEKASAEQPAQETPAADTATAEKTAEEMKAASE